MNIEDIKYGELKKIAKMFEKSAVKAGGIDDFAMGKYVIIRTYSAGVWFGVLSKKSGNEVVLTNARRMWRWWAEESISLSGVALYGIKQDKSKIAPPVPEQWLEAIEITPTSDGATKSIKDAPYAQAGQ